MVHVYQVLLALIMPFDKRFLSIHPNDFSVSWFMRLEPEFESTSIVLSVTCVTF